MNHFNCLKQNVEQGGKGKKNSKENITDNSLGLLRIIVIRRIHLAIRDVQSSDPYIIFSLSKQKVRTRTIKKSLNPEWNEELSLSVLDPSEPVKLYVYDYDEFTLDDKMGDAEFEIKYLMEAIDMNFEDLPDGTIITKVIPDSRVNCISQESCIVWRDGQVIQNMFLKLRNVEHGEIELQLKWIPNTTQETV